MFDVLEWVYCYKKNKEKLIPKYWEKWENVKKQCFFAVFSAFLIFHKILVVKSFESFSQRRWDQCMYFVNFFQNFIRWIFCKTRLLSRHNFCNHVRNFVPSSCANFFEFLMCFPLSRDSILEFWCNFINYSLRTNSFSEKMILVGLRP